MFRETSLYIKKSEDNRIRISMDELKYYNVIRKIKVRRPENMSRPLCKECSKYDVVTDYQQLLYARIGCR
jgi:hypothetical protein